MSNVLYVSRVAAEGEAPSAPLKLLPYRFPKVGVKGKATLDGAETETMVTKWKDVTWTYVMVAGASYYFAEKGDFSGGVFVKAEAPSKPAKAEAAKPNGEAPKVEGENPAVTPVAEALAAAKAKAAEKKAAKAAK